MQEIARDEDLDWFPIDAENYIGNHSLCFVENFEMKDGPYLHELSKTYDGDWGNPIFWIDEYFHIIRTFCCCCCYQQFSCLFTL